MGCTDIAISTPRELRLRSGKHGTDPAASRPAVSRKPQKRFDRVPTTTSLSSILKHQQ